jgi:hypothetical protein
MVQKYFGVLAQHRFHHLPFLFQLHVFLPETIIKKYVLALHKLISGPLRSEFNLGHLPQIWEPIGVYTQRGLVNYE